MVFHWKSNSVDIPTDHFKINDIVNTNLSIPYGNFIEEAMVWIDDERTRLGITDPPLQWFVYDKFVPVSSGGAGLNGVGWVQDSDNDSQRLEITPLDIATIQAGGSGSTQLKTYFPKIRDVVGDVASGLYDVLLHYAGFDVALGSMDPPLSRADPSVVFSLEYACISGMNFAASNPAQKPYAHLLKLEDLAEGLSTEDQDFFEVNPEFDDNLNIVRPKLCIAVLFDDRLTFYNVLPKLIDDTLAGITNQNKVAEILFRDDTWTKLTGATAFQISRGADPRTLDIWVAFGSTLRRFDIAGRPRKILPPTVDAYSITLGGAAHGLAIFNYTGSPTSITYLSGGAVFNFDVATSTTTALPVKKYAGGGRAVTGYTTNSPINPPGDMFDLITTTEDTFAASTITPITGFTDILFDDLPSTTQEAGALFAAPASPLVLFDGTSVAYAVEQPAQIPEYGSDDLNLIGTRDLGASCDSAVPILAPRAPKSRTDLTDILSDRAYLCEDGGTISHKAFYTQIPSESADSIIKDIAVGNGGPPGVPPGTGSITTYLTGGLGGKACFDSTTLGGGGLWGSRQERGIIKLTMKKVKDLIDAGTYTSPVIELDVKITREAADPVVSNKKPDGFSNPPTMWTNPGGGVIKSFTAEIGLYTGVWPVVTDMTNFEAFGTSLLTMSFGAAVTRNNETGHLGPTFDMPNYDTITIDPSDINASGELFLMLRKTSGNDIELDNSILSVEFGNVTIEGTLT